MTLQVTLKDVDALTKRAISADAASENIALACFFGHRQAVANSALLHGVLALNWTACSL
jgi:hypothetical protein